MTQPQHTQAGQQLISVDNWRNRAECLSVDPEVWFPDPSDADGIALAVNICGTCPVRDACLEDEMAREGTIHVAARHGIRGGLTPQQRFNLYRRGTRRQARSGQ